MTIWTYDKFGNVVHAISPSELPDNIITDAKGDVVGGLDVSHLEHDFSYTSKVIVRDNKKRHHIHNVSIQQGFLLWDN